MSEFFSYLQFLLFKQLGYFVDIKRLEGLNVLESFEVYIHLLSLHPNSLSVVSQHTNCAILPGNLTDFVELQATGISILLTHKQIRGCGQILAGDHLVT